MYKRQIEGNPHESNIGAFTGSGGISKISWSNAYLLSQYWSIGINVSYLFGNIVLSEQQNDVAVNRRKSWLAKGIRAKSREKNRRERGELIREIT